MNNKGLKFMLKNLKKSLKKKTKKLWQIRSDMIM